MSSFIMYNLGIALMGSAYEFCEDKQNVAKLDYHELCNYLMLIENLLWFLKCQRFCEHEEEENSYHLLFA